MCGICGEVRYDGQRANARLVERMKDLLRHRGPDDEGLWETEFDGGGIALGHTRLAILDLTSAGRQPMCDPTQRYWITYNGEVYNYRELREDLKKDDFVFRTRTDTEVVLAAYVKYGVECLSLFNGMFSFAIWDDREKSLFCARDRLGIKPFYYFFHGGILHFASEIKALTKGARISTEINDNMVYDYLTFCLLDHSAETFFNNILQLPPGCYFYFDGDVPKPLRYWELNAGKDTDENETSILEKFKALFHDSVRLRLRSDVPVGILLSGGLDSSAIACTVSEIIAPQKPATFSSTMKGIGLDETGFSNEVARYIGAVNTKLFPKSSNFWDELDPMLYALDEPAHASDIYANWCMMRAVHKEGIKVLLNGQGGDELLGGYNWYAKNFLTSLLLSGDFWPLIKEMRALRTNFPNSMTGNYVHMIANIVDALLPARIKRPFKEEIGGSRKVLRDSFLRINSWRDEHNIDLINAPTLEEKTKNDILYFNIPHYLHYEDRNSMAFSIEERVPFLDHRLVEWAFSLSAKWKIHDGKTKYVLRRAMENRLPDLVLNRKDKMGLSIPIERWFRDDFKVKLTKLFNENCHIYDKWVEKKPFVRQVDAYVNGKKTAIDRQMWRFFCLERWLRVIANEESP